ncbi:MAG: leucine-rich repeat domain-containing protein, partial [Bacteroidales bacterium]|nr:leucine-rich repeat domain-containing protein [Bacteroidales bacterium]
MKQRFFIPVLSILLFLAAGCQQPELTQPVRGTNILKAAIEGGQTKTQLGQSAEGTYYAFWSENDSLAVYVNDKTSADPYVLTAGAGTRNGTFAGTVSGTRYVALYPYRDKSSAGVTSDSFLILEIPAVQKYAPNSFGAGAFPMVAVGEGPELKFWNLFSVLKVSMTGSVSVNAVRFSRRPDVQFMPVSGKAKVGLNFLPQNGPEIIMTGENATTDLTLQCDGVQLSEDVATDFFLALPPGFYKGGFSLEVETDGGIYTHVVASDVTFVRSQYRHIAPFRVEPVDTDPTPENEIWYKNEDDRLLPLAPAWFDRTILSHSYSGGYCKIVFDGPVTRVGNESGDVVFGSSTSEIRLPDCVEQIGANAFQMSRIVSFRVPESLKSMGDGALSWTSALKHLFGKGVTEDGLFLILDGRMVAYAAAALPEGTLVVPAGVTSLAPRLFFAQNKIHDVILSEEMRSIGDGCFGYNDMLETVTFPKNFTDLGMYVFERCFELREFKGDNPCVKEGRLFVTPD